MVVIGKCGCNQAGWLYSGKSGCSWAKVVLFGQSGCIPVKWLYSGKGVVFG